MRYSSVIFDVGDTLVEYAPNYAALYADRLRLLGYSVDEALARRAAKAVYRAGGEQSRKEQSGAPRMPDGAFSRMLDEAALRCAVPAEMDIAPLLDRLAEVPLPKQEMSVKSGVYELLARLREHGYRLAIVSNHGAGLMDYLSERGLAPFFETIVISAIVGVEKPNPEIMRIALRNLGEPPEKCLYVGDHELDVLCAKEAGVDIAWICEEDATLPESIPHEADYRIRSACDVERVLAGD